MWIDCSLSAATKVVVTHALSHSLSLSSSLSHTHTIFLSLFLFLSLTLSLSLFLEGGGVLVCRPAKEDSQSGREMCARLPRVAIRGTN
jgi:hypothetical protein